MRTLRDVPLNELFPKNNLGANAQIPGAANDATQGYSHGSRWVAGGNEYVCVDPAISAAVWKTTTAGVIDSGGGTTDPGTGGTVTGTVLGGAPVDDFNDNVVDPTKWSIWKNTDSIAREANGQLELVVDAVGGWAAFDGIPTFDLTNRSATLRLVSGTNPGTTGVSSYFEIQDANNSGNGYRWVLGVNNNLFAQYRVNAGTWTTRWSAAYSQTAHRFLRIRHANNKILFDVCNSTGTWSYDVFSGTQTAGGIDPLFTHTAMKTRIRAGGGTGGTFVWDDSNINVPAESSSTPPAAVDYNFQDNFNDNVIDTAKWSNSTTVQSTLTLVFERNTRIEIESHPTAAAYPGLGSSLQDATGKTNHIEILDPAQGGATTSFEALYRYMRSSMGAGGTMPYAEFWLRNGTITCRYRTVSGGTGTISTLGSAVTYDTAIHKWLRFRDDAGTLRWEYSTNKSTWTQFPSAALATNTTNWFGGNLTNMIIEVRGQTLSTGLSPTRTAIWDNFNT